MYCVYFIATGGGKRGRPTKPLSRAAKAHKRRHGTLASCVHSRSAPNAADSVSSITILQRRLLPADLAALKSIVGRAWSYPATGWDFATSKHHHAYHIAPLADALQAVVARIAPSHRTQLRFLDMSQVVQPWMLETCGRCKPHTDAEWRHERRNPGWTLLFVVSCDAPYTMRFWGHNNPDNLDRQRRVDPVDFVVDAGQYLMFPAAVYHECIADPTENRTVINCIITLRVAP